MIFFFRESRIVSPHASKRQEAAYIPAAIKIVFSNAALYESLKWSMRLFMPLPIKNMPITLTKTAIIAAADRCPFSSSGMSTPDNKRGMAIANEESAYWMAPSGFGKKKSIQKNKTTQMVTNAAFQ